MFRPAALSVSLFMAVSAFAVQSPIVDCNTGQAIRRAPAGIDKTQPSTLTIKGTCTEYVLEGFNNLTVNGLDGATLRQPDTTPPTNPGYVLLIRASPSVTISKLAVGATPPVFSRIGIGQGSSDIVLQQNSMARPPQIAFGNPPNHNNTPASAIERLRAQIRQRIRLPQDFRSRSYQP